MTQELQKFVDKDQSKRINLLEEKITILENKFTEIITKLETLTNVGKVIAMAAGLALGIDIAPMV